MRWALGVLLLILVILQYRLWIAEGSLAEQQRLKGQVQEFIRVNEQLRERNAVLEREVLELQGGNKGVEQRAREQLGLVREGETYYQLVEEDDMPAQPAATLAGDQP
jgi:cell division protein FtsB